MIKSIKVDVVYFMTATDFEFEFNLGSCCHMRLLNDKANDKKSFVNSLARAVSRSQIIICCGPLFGEDGLIATAATAIGHGLKTVVNEAYGIEAADSVEIIDGGIPLVTPEGYFGGCVIESGNQSIILLTENRTVRKSIMKTLIHPYIEDMSILQSAEKGAITATSEVVSADAAAAEPVANTMQETPGPIAEPAPEVAENIGEQPQVEAPVLDANEKTEVASELAPEGTDEPQATVSDEPATEPQDTAPALSDDDVVHNIEFDYFNDEPDEPEKEEDIPAPEVPEEFLFDNETENDVGGKTNIPIIIVTVILVLAILGLSYFLIYLPIKNGVSPIDYFHRIFDTSARIGILGK